MIAALTWRFVREVDPRLLFKFSYTFGWKGICAVQRFKNRTARGDYFPAFIFISLTSACNLNCRGCWVPGRQSTVQLPPTELDRIIAAAKQQGSHFFGLLGGEPLLYDDLFDVLARHPDCYFQLFTNGTLLTDEVAGRLRSLGNVTPLISLEGDAAVSDQRRGGTDVFARSREGLAACHRHKLVTGVATSVCQNNFDYVRQESFIDDLVKQGVHYLWYYIYRPVGPHPAPDLALDADQIHTLRQHLVDLRNRAPLAVIDAYWDADGNALCPAAVGISHHINPNGDLEPCPPIQFAKENLADHPDLEQLFLGSEFLRRFRQLATRHSRGCILLENPELLVEFMKEQNAQDSSGRGSGISELEARTPLPGHDQPDRKIPESNAFYRFAKKHWFFGFGAYG